MRFDCRLLVITSLATISLSTNLFAEGGVVLEKSESWSPEGQVASVREFSRVVPPASLETGYKEYFIGPDGKRFGIYGDKIVKVIFYPDIESYVNILDEAQLSPILSDVSELKSLAAKYRLAKPYLDRQISKFEHEISLFRQGERKINRVWHSAEEIARQRQQAADAKEKLQAPSAKWAA
jgi:hypothetical protein